MYSDFFTSILHFMIFVFSEISLPFIPSVEFFISMTLFFISAISTLLFFTPSCNFKEVIPFSCLIYSISSSLSLRILKLIF